MSRKNRNRGRSWPPPKPSTPAIIDIPSSDPTDAGPPPADGDGGDGALPPKDIADSAAPQADAEPLLECSVVAHSDKVTISGVNPDVAEVLSGKVLGRNVTEVRLKKNKAVVFRVFSPRARAEVGAAAKTWVGKWLARLGALCLWAVFVTFLFGEIGLVGWVLDRLGASASWEGVVLLGVLAVLLLGSAMMSVGGSAKVLL